MSELNINVEGGSSTKLLTAGKYCPDDIIITASGGGGGEVEPIELSGNQQYAFYGQMGTIALEYLGNKISTKNIVNSSYMFQQNQCERIPFEINFDNSTYREMGYMFSNCRNLKELPKINNAYPDSIENIFEQCESLRNIPDNYFDNWDFSRIQSNKYGDISDVFSLCFSLRKVPKSLLSNLWNSSTSASYTMYNNCFKQCYTLDEVKDIPIQQSDFTSNVFKDTVLHCYRIKDFTFETNEDGTAKTVKWKTQTIDLSQNVGYAPSNMLTRITGYNSGITQDKEVKDDATYQALKNDNDWFSVKKEYSRYNHDSAVNTINSLPDTSAYLATSGGTNAIKFRDGCGSATDAGGIDSLTSEEIAVATAKGWTVYRVA